MGGGAKNAAYLLVLVLVLLFHSLPLIVLFSNNNADAANENPNGYLKGITDNLGTIQDSWYIQPNTSFYSTIMNNYNNSYNSESTALQISTKEQFAAFGKAVNEGGKDFSGKYVKLMNDIDLQGSGITFTNSSSGDFTVTIAKNGTPTNLWNPVGNTNKCFKGTFNGQSHEIKNMIAVRYSSSEQIGVGIFGYVESSSIYNVKVAGNSSVYGKGSSVSYILGGGIVGKLTGSNIYNCVSSANIYATSATTGNRAGGIVGTICSNSTMSNCSSLGNVYSYSNTSTEFVYAGGLAGYSHSNSTIRNSHAEGNSYGISGKSDIRVGGMIGDVRNTTISGCYATGFVSGYFNSNFSEVMVDVGGLLGNIENSEITESYATGIVQAYGNGPECHSNVGGFIGDYYSSTVSNCYATGNVTSYAYFCPTVGGFIGRSKFTDIKNCYATGNVNSTAELHAAHGGGLVGEFDKDGNISNSYSVGNVYCYANSGNGTPSAGGFVGVDNYGGTTTKTNCYRNSGATVQNKLGTTNCAVTTVGTETALSNLKGTVTNTISGFNSDNAWKFISGDYPALKVFTKDPSQPSAITTTYSPTLKLSNLAISDSFTGSYGTWAWSSPNTSVGNAGTKTFSATFTPNDPRSYNSATKSITVTVNKANPICNVPTNCVATYRQTLNDVTLENPTGNTSGTWAWTDTTTPVGDIGEKTFLATFTPTDATNYNTMSNIPITIAVGIGDISVSMITEQGRKLLELTSDSVYDDSCTISTSRDGVETVKFMSNEYPGGAVTHALETVSGSFIQNQKFTMIDCSNSAPQYYYYIVETDSLSQIPLTSFKLMEDRTTAWVEPSCGAVSDKLQFIVDFSDTDQSTSRSAQNLKLSYKSDNTEISSGIVTFNFGDSSFYGEISKSGQDVVMKARSINVENAYAVAKITDLDGNQLSFSNKQSLSSNLGTFEIVRGGFAILKLGELSETLTTYTLSNLSVTGLPNMSYKIQISLCLSDEDNKYYPFTTKNIGSVVL